MTYYRCKCGHREFWGSGMCPQPCQTCSKCGSTLATCRENLKEPIPHQWKKQFNVNTGLPSRPICERCYEKGDMPNAQATEKPGDDDGTIA